MLADILGPDLLIVAIVLVVLLFGGAAIPKLARNLGSAKNEFEKGLDKSTTTPVVHADGVTVPVAPADGAIKAIESPNLSPGPLANDLPRRD